MISRLDRMLSSHADAVHGEGMAVGENSSKPMSNRLWPRATTLLLLLLGLAMAAFAFLTVASMPSLSWHPARSAELQATYDAYRTTGTLLIKETGSGSYGVQGPADGPLTFATWDDDPGSYIIASLMGDVTGSDSPYPGLKLAQALFVAIPLIWLPLAVARVVGRARAGYALILLPLVVWLLNHGARLIGTEYGLSDRVSTLPVYSLYGTAASLAFLSLSLVVLISTYRLRTFSLVAVTIGISVLAAFGNMSRSLSGMGVAAAVATLWWIHVKGKWRWAAALGGAAAAIVLAMVVQTGIMNAINAQRVETTGQSASELPVAHTAWHSMYLGLSYPQPITGEPSRFGVIWSDEFGWTKAREVDPDVVVASEEYDQILKGLYFDKVLSDPLGAVKLYAEKAIFVAEHFGGLLILIAAGFGVGMSIRSGPGRRFGRVLAMALPLLALGLVPAVLVMPMLYYYSELSAVLGLLAAASLGILVWALTSWPARTRIRERLRAVAPPVMAGGIALSVVMEEGALSTEELNQLAHGVDERTELIVVAASEVPEASSATCLLLDTIGIGARLRAGVLATSGDRVLVIGAPPAREPAELLEAARSTMVPTRYESTATRGRKTPGRFCRQMLLGSSDRASHRIVALDGRRARAVALVTQEPGELWFDEFTSGCAFEDATDELSLPRPEVAVGESRRRTGGRQHPLRGYFRLALRREEVAAAARS